jgi:hypothetical protein
MKGNLKEIITEGIDDFSKTFEDEAWNPDFQVKENFFRFYDAI